MNNDLKQFSEKRLRLLTDYSGTNAELQWGEIEALARIALAAKQAKPIGFVGKSYAMTYFMPPQDSGVEIDDLIYTAPQPAHTEQVIPDGWKLVPIEPTYEMKKHYYDASVAPISKLSVTGYRAMLSAAPKPESE